MNNTNNELNNLPSMEATASGNPNAQVAADLTNQNAVRAKELVKERLSKMTPEQIAALRNAKQTKSAAAAASASEPVVEAPQASVAEAAQVEVAQPVTTQSEADDMAVVRAVKVAEAAAAVAVDKAVPAKKKSHKKGPRISYESKQAFSGFMFVLPWFIGFLLFFAAPCLESLQFSFSKVDPYNQYSCTWNGIANYTKLLTKEPTFMQALTDTLTDLTVNVPVVLIFSLFVAVLLNRKFPGRGLVRGIFFLPVIVTTGVVMSTFSHSDSEAAFSGTMNRGILFQMTDASEFLVDLGLNETITQYMTDVADRIFDVVWDSGVQILLFLAALQGISPQLYEASSVEGATAWETFWLITFPNVAPIILVNIVYTIVDTYNDPENLVLAQIETYTGVTFNFGGAAAISWTFFAVILLILGIVFGVYAFLTRKSR